jgi:hypothetical protein
MDGLIFASWGNWIFDADNQLYVRWHSSARDTAQGGKGQSSLPYGNPEFDQLVEQARVELDEKKRLDLYKKAQEILYEDAAALFMYTLTGIYGVDNYVSYLRNAARGDFGESIRQRGRRAMDIVLDRYPATLRLAFLALSCSVILATVFGVISAVKWHSALDNVVMLLALFGQSVPNFWLGIMLILIFAVQLGWLPSQGEGDGGQRYMPLPITPRTSRCSSA